MTNIFDEVYNGVTYCRPEAYYFWFYYFFMNWIWIMVPGYYLYDATKKVAASVRRLAQIDAGRKTI
ncbi:hypothetical protein KEM55_007577 [Ascosphaera atra]|nr:hypothetical protein KEM55_007577 [Ascosphaera atra]